MIIGHCKLHPADSASCRRSPAQFARSLAIEPGQTVLWETCRSHGTSRAGAAITRFGIKSFDHRPLPAVNSPLERFFASCSVPLSILFRCPGYVPVPLLDSHTSARGLDGNETASIWVPLPNRRGSLPPHHSGFHPSILLVF